MPFDHSTTQDVWSVSVPRPNVAALLDRIAKLPLPPTVTASLDHRAHVTLYCAEAPLSGYTMLLLRPLGGMVRSGMEGRRRATGDRLRQLAQKWAAQTPEPPPTEDGCPDTCPDECPNHGHVSGE